MKNPPTIVSIDPGGKFIGVAVFRGSDLRYWATKRIAESGRNKGATVRKFEKILSDLVGRYQPGVILTQSPYFPQQNESRSLREIIRRVKTIAEKEKIRSFEVNPLKVRRFLYKTGRPTKMRVAETICQEYYPFLLPDYRKDLDKKWWQEKYYVKMFNAIALGIFYLKNSTRGRRNLHR